MTNQRTWSRTGRGLALGLGLALLAVSRVAAQQDLLPSWNDGPTKQAIIAFVAKVTTPGSADFVPVSERVATFDNDGTLWSEQPLPTQLYFALDRVKALAPQHPEWATEEPFASLLKGDVQSALAGGEKALVQIVMATHAGMTTAQFEQIVTDWIATAKHPQTGRRFTDQVYQPMLELLAYLRTNGFKTFIVSGGGIEFMRPWAEQVYGVPPEQVVGSSIKTVFEMQAGGPVLNRLAEVNFVDDKGGKPVGINEHIGRRPTMAFGNSNGDREMLEYTYGGGGARFELLVLHDDGIREFAYGPAQGLPSVAGGAFKQDLYDQAKQEGWTVVSMKNDWKTVYPAPQSEITAIDVLLEPDSVMLRHARTANARLLKAYPQGFALDATHRPHITLLQLFVRTADLPQVYAALDQVFAGARRMKLDAYKYYYAPAGTLGVAGIVAKPTPGLLALQSRVIDAMGPFMLTSGPIGAFTAGHGDQATDEALIGYVGSFARTAAGAHFNPHVTIGTAPRTFLDPMLAEPFTPFGFSAAGAAVYQLGPYGTAARQLKTWRLIP
jgi:phosphoserine phosphatase